MLSTEGPSRSSPGRIRGDGVDSGVVNEKRVLHSFRPWPRQPKTCGHQVSEERTSGFATLSTRLDMAVGRQPFYGLVDARLFRALVKSTSKRGSPCRDFRSASATISSGA